MNINDPEVRRLSKSDEDVQSLPIDLIDEDASRDFQPRSLGLDKVHVADLMNHINDLPPIDIMLIDGVYTILSGHHTFAAHKALGHTTIPAHMVSPEEPLQYAYEANLKHGLKYSLRDRRTYATFLLEYGVGLSMREIGRRAGLSDSTVRSLKEAGARIAQQADDPPNNGKRRWPKPHFKITQDQRRLLRLVERADTALDVLFAGSEAIDGDLISEAVRSAYEDDGVAKRAHDLGVGAEYMLNIARTLGYDAP